MALADISDDTKKKSWYIQIRTNIQSITKASKQKSQSRAKDVIDRSSEKKPNDLAWSAMTRPGTYPAKNAKNANVE